MTVSATNAYDTAVGNGSATVFNFTFRCKSAAEVAVYLDGVKQTTGFTVTVNANGVGGAVTFTSAPAIGVAVAILSDPAFTQLVSFVNAGAFLPQSHDDANDRAAIRAIRLKSDVDRSIKVPLGETGSVLPSAADRADRVMAFDVLGNVYAPDVSAANLETLAGITGNITTVAGVAGNVTTVAGSIVNVNAVAGSITNVNTVATNIGAVNTCATNIAAIIDAPNQATAAANSATAAAASASYFPQSFSEVTSPLMGFLRDDSAQVFARTGLDTTVTPNVVYDYRTGSNSVNVSNKGYRSPFKADGSKFNVVELSLRAFSANTWALIKIWDSTLTEIARGYQVFGTTVRTASVALSKMVDQAAGNICYISYEPVDQTGPALGSPGSGGTANIYPAGDADPLVYHEAIFTTSNVWSNIASNRGNFCIPFRGLRYLGLDMKPSRADFINYTDNAYGMLKTVSSVLELASTVTPGFARGDPTTGNSSVNVTLSGFRTPFRTDASYGSTGPFNAITLSLRVNTAPAVVRCQILDSSRTTIIAEATLTLKSTDLKQRTFLTKQTFTLTPNTDYYIAYFTDDPTIAVSQATGGAYDPQDSNTATFPGQTRVIPSTSWANLSPVTADKIGFGLLDLTQASSGGAASDPDAALLLPSKIRGAQGLQLNIYKRDLTIGPVSNYFFSMPTTPEVGQHGSDQWRAVGTGSDNLVAGAFSSSMTVSVYSKKRELLSTATTTVSATASSAKAGATEIVLFIGDSFIAEGTIVKRVVDLGASTHAPNVTAIGTRGTAPYKNEGRGGWATAYYTNAGLSDYLFTVSGVVAAPAPNSTQYTNNAVTFTVQEVNLDGSGNGTILCSTLSGAPTASGTLTKVGTSDPGDATITFSASAAQPGNPFWNPGTSSLDFNYYLTTNSLPAPTIVFIEQGIGDVASAVSDTAAQSKAITASANVEALITMIHAYDPNIKVVVNTIPAGSATQNSSGYQLGDSGPDQWRYEANIKILNKQRIASFDNREASKVYLCPIHLFIDRLNNFFTITRNANSQTTIQEVVQTNLEHPAPTGYNQYGDGCFAMVKAI